MRQLCKTVYQYDELTEDAKDRARQWYREASSGDFVEYQADSVLEDAVRLGNMIGLTFQTRTVPLMNGTTRQDPIFYWDLGRGSFLVFGGNYAYRPGAVAAVKTEAPQDTDLHAIAETLQAIQRPAFYRLQASIGMRRGEYFDVDVERSDDVAPTDEQTETIVQAVKDFASWVWGNLQKEAEYQESDDVVDENIRANEYEFTEDGRRAC